MDFLTGQVFKTEKISDRIKKAKEKRIAAENYARLSSDFGAALKECETLKKAIDCISDKDLLEANIYRLKAAELSLNYHIKSAKNTLS